MGWSLLGDEREVVLGEIPVLARLSFGSERLILFVTSRRIIVAHGGKRGAGSVTATSLLGGLGRAFEGLVKGGGESVKRNKLEDISPTEILSSHRDNFALRFDEVVSFDIVEYSDKTRVTLLSRDDKFDFTTLKHLDVLVALLGVPLGGKLTARVANEEPDVSPQGHHPSKKEVRK